MEPGPVPVGQPGLGQQEAQCRGKKGMGEVGRSWKHQGEMPWVEEQKERQRGLPASEGQTTIACWAHGQSARGASPGGGCGMGSAAPGQFSLGFFRCFSSGLAWTRCSWGGRGCRRNGTGLSQNLAASLPSPPSATTCWAAVHSATGHCQRVGLPRRPGVLLRDALGAKVYCLGESGSGVRGVHGEGPGPSAVSSEGAEPYWDQGWGSPHRHESCSGLLCVWGPLHSHHQYSALSHPQPCWPAQLYLQDWVSQEIEKGTLKSLHTCGQKPQSAGPLQHHFKGIHGAASAGIVKGFPGGTCGQNSK